MHYKVSRHKILQLLYHPSLACFSKVFITHPPAKFNSKSVCKHRPLNSPSKAKQNTTICFFSSGEEKKDPSTNLKYEFKNLRIYPSVFTSSTNSIIPPNSNSINVGNYRKNRRDNTYKYQDNRLLCECLVQLLTSKSYNLTVRQHRLA